MRSGQPRRSDAGSASIWVLSVVALLMVVAGIVSVRGLAVLARHRAETAADLASLAGAGQIGVSERICAAVSVVAARNGATLRACTLALAPDARSGTVVARVVVRVDLPLVGAREVVASARAGRLAVLP
ncbi:MAG: hypothetical protein QOH52_172 [Pseudonocardiales bacterium]|nr:hypothetical protein [Pseudonocardiales bacterium]